MTTSQPVTAVDFYFDSMCPWAYQTSLWIKDVAAQTGLTVNWKFFSLEEINREGAVLSYRGQRFLLPRQ